MILDNRLYVPARWLAIVATASVLAIAAVSLAASWPLFEEESNPAWVALDPSAYRDAVLEEKNRSDPVLALYRAPEAQEEVVAFFAAIVHSEKLARIILSRSEEYEVSPSLSAALSWEESRYNERAVNRNKSSVDRGLFQLNSKSFPKMTETEFFDPDLNARYGIAHLRWCLDVAGTDVAALAMYNAGTTRVKSDATPKKTLDYVARILSFKAGIDALYERDVLSRWLIEADGRVSATAPRKAEEPRIAAALFPLLSGKAR